MTSDLTRPIETIVNDERKKKILLHEYFKHNEMRAVSK